MNRILARLGKNDLEHESRPGGSKTGAVMTAQAKIFYLCRERFDVFCIYITEEKVTSQKNWQDL